MRPKHYVKNLLILLPLIFGSQLFKAEQWPHVIVALVTFSLIASAVYVINDIRDVAKDRKHPQKKFRPIAAGNVSKTQAWGLVAVLVGVTLAVGVGGNLSLISWGLLAAYLAINIAYSFGLKNVPIADVALLASGFIVRVLFGSSIFGIEMSPWLYLTILAGAFYVSLGKRRNEIKTNGTQSRKVNERYSLQFLDKNMYVCLTLTLVFYSLWASDPVRASWLLYATIPFIIIIFMNYSLKIEQDDSTGDPVDVLFKSKSLRVLIPLFFAALILAVYLT